MSDRRSLLSNGRVAYEGLRGQVEADRFVPGVRAEVAAVRTPLLDQPGGKRERELLLGQGFLALEEAEGHVFGCALRDGYVGYVAASDLREGPDRITHRVAAPRSYAKPTASLKAYEPVTDLSFGSLLRVTGAVGNWSEVALPGRAPLYLPSRHLAPVASVESDPVEVAARFLGTPYLWGGNSGFGIDCSGLVQAALHACGRECPGDSDQQQARLGPALPAGTPPQRGDLLFWKGHVAFVADPDTLLHANAWAMAVAYEPLAEALARIEGQGDGPVTAHLRPA